MSIVSWPGNELPLQTIVELVTGAAVGAGVGVGGGVGGGGADATAFRVAVFPRASVQVIAHGLREMIAIRTDAAPNPASEPPDSDFDGTVRERPYAPVAGFCTPHTSGVVVMVNAPLAFQRTPLNENRTGSVSTNETGLRLRFDKSSSVEFTRKKNASAEAFSE